MMNAGGAATHIANYSSWLKNKFCGVFVLNLETVLYLILNLTAHRYKVLIDHDACTLLLGVCGYFLRVQNPNGAYLVRDI